MFTVILSDILGRGWGVTMEVTVHKRNIFVITLPSVATVHEYRDKSASKFPKKIIMQVMDHCTQSDLS
jgi:hypothetical protein